MSTAFEDFCKNRDEQSNRVLGLQKRLQVNEAETGVVLSKYDEATIANLDLTVLQAKLDRLEREKIELIRQIAALEKAPFSENNISLANLVLEDNKKRLAKLRTGWDGLLDELEDLRGEYLQVIQKLGTLYQSGQTLSNQIMLAREALPKGTPIVYIEGVGGDINLDSLRGSFFFDNNIIKDTFRKGENR